MRAFVRACCLIKLFEKCAESTTPRVSSQQCVCSGGAFVRVESCTVKRHKRAYGLASLLATHTETTYTHTHTHNKCSSSRVRVQHNISNQLRYSTELAKHLHNINPPSIHIDVVSDVVCARVLRSGGSVGAEDIQKRCVPPSYFYIRPHTHTRMHIHIRRSAFKRHIHSMLARKRFPHYPPRASVARDCNTIQNNVCMAVGCAFARQRLRFRHAPKHAHIALVFKAPYHVQGERHAENFSPRKKQRAHPQNARPHRNTSSHPCLCSVARQYIHIYVHSSHPQAYNSCHALRAGCYAAANKRQRRGALGEVW